MKLAEEVNEMGQYVGIDASSEEDRMVSAYNYCSRRGLILIGTA